MDFLNSAENIHMGHALCVINRSKILPSVFCILYSVYFALMGGVFALDLYDVFLGGR